MDPINPKRRGRKLFGARRKLEGPSEAGMELQNPLASPATDSPAVRLDRVHGGTVDPSAREETPVGGGSASGDSDAESDPADTPANSPAAVALLGVPKVDVDILPTDRGSEGTPDHESGDTGMTQQDRIGQAAGLASDVARAVQSGPTLQPGSEEAPVADDDDAAVIPYLLPRIVAIANQKGGVGKTTTSVNLGASLADLGFRVLVVDLDPQGNATTGLGVNARDLTTSIYDVIMSDAAIEDSIEPTSLKNLFVAPATIDLAGAEIELVPAFSRELKLRRALHEIRDDYDYILIDCPPSLGLLTVNGLAAADDVLVPIQCEYYALEGLSQLIRNVTLVRTNLNPTLEVRGIVLTMYDARTKLADQVEQEVRTHFGRTVYETVIPRTVRLSEAPSFGQPIILFDPTSRGAVAYRELAKEVSHGATRRTR